MQGALVTRFTKDFVEKHSFDCQDLSRRKVKPITPVNSDLLRNIKAKVPPRNSCCKDFAKFRVNVSGRVHLQKS